MTYCQSCGSPVEGKFCAKCGAAVGAGAGDATPSTIPTATPASSVMADNVASALCYVPVLGPLVFLLMEPYNKNKGIRFHAWQSLCILGVYIVASILVNILGEIASSLYFLHSLVHLAFVVVCFYVGYKVYSGERLVLPILGPIAEKQA